MVFVDFTTVYCSTEHLIQAYILASYRAGNLQDGNAMQYTVCTRSSSVQHPAQISSQR
jgi:hypothetical protein